MTTEESSGHPAGFEYDEDVAAALVRGIGAFIRVAQMQKLTPTLRRLRTFRPQTLVRHRSELLASLNDDDLRAAIIEWLGEGHVPLTKRESEVLRVAAAREDGWEQLLAPARTPRKSVDSSGAVLKAKVARLEDQLARERDKVRAARAEARRAKEEVKRAVEARREMQEQLKSDAAALHEARIEARRAAAETERVRSTADKDARRITREAEKVAARAEEHGKQLREARKDLRRAERRAAEQEAESERLKGRIGGLKKRIEALQADVERLTGQLQSGAESAQASRARRKRVPAARAGRVPLGVPKGRMPEDPQTLEEWLGAPEVELLVDGYNVTKAEGGYGGVSLERQRERLVAEVGTLVARKRVRTVIIFDGSEVSPGRGRRLRGGVIVEYSAPGETADDYIIGLLEASFREQTVAPAIVVTNDRGLQDRAGALGATIATSNQLLSLIR